MGRTLAAALAAVLAAGGSGCSSYDPGALARGEEFSVLEPLAGKGGRHRVLVAPVRDARGEAEPAELRSAMRLDAPALAAELRRALERVFPGGDEPSVEVADPTLPAAEQAWEGGYDLVLEARVRRWDAVFLDTNGWWLPNALFLAWYFWPIGPHWVIADELYGVDCDLELSLLSAGSERPLPLREPERRVRVRSLAPDEEESAGAADELLAPPRLALDDLDRGLDLFGTWTPGDLDEEQWSQVGTLLEPIARRHAAVRGAAAVAKAVARFDRLDEREKERLLAATHAVVVGVSAYAEPCAGADADAEAFAALLAGDVPALGPDGRPLDPQPPREERRWAPPKNVALLLNGQARCANVLEALERVAARAQPQDQVVFYFAGRGLRRSDGALALLPGGGDEQPLLLSDLAAALRRVPARRRLVVFDADFQAGARGVGPRSGPPAGWPEALRELFLADASAGALVVATSLAADEEAQADAGHGLLTRYLVEGLAGAADADADGLSYADLDRYLQERVVNYSEVACERPQRPRLLSLGPGERLR
ncbi:MAG: hypothetical protein D6731_00205 [Planctomycetota bacterium]|nr:MAG: hypothetical protein D6731_00205 [Planctomycetota bacterium]